MDEKNNLMQHWWSPWLSYTSKTFLSITPLRQTWRFEGWRWAVILAKRWLTSALASICMPFWRVCVLKCISMTKYVKGINKFKYKRKERDKWEKMVHGEWEARAWHICPKLFKIQFFEWKLIFMFLILSKTSNACGSQKIFTKKSSTSHLCFFPMLIVNQYVS